MDGQDRRSVSHFTDIRCDTVIHTHTCTLGTFLSLSSGLMANSWLYCTPPGTLLMAAMCFLVYSTSLVGLDTYLSAIVGIGGGGVCVCVCV